MNRDHMMGYAPIAQHVADLADTSGYFWNWTNPYAVGIPNRVRAEWEAHPIIEPEPVPDPFETINQPLPNGRVVFTDAQLARRAAARDAQARAQEAHLKGLTASDIRAQLEAAWDKAEKEGRDPFTATAVAARDRVTGHMNFDCRVKISDALAQMDSKLNAQQNYQNLAALAAKHWENAAQTLREEVDADLRAALHIPF